jgi:hypothetical protein
MTFEHDLKEVARFQRLLLQLQIFSQCGPPRSVMNQAVQSRFLTFSCAVGITIDCLVGLFAPGSYPQVPRMEMFRLQRP